MLRSKKFSEAVAYGFKHCTDFWLPMVQELRILNRFGSRVSDRTALLYEFYVRKSQA